MINAGALLTNSGDGIVVTKSIHEKPYVSILAIEAGTAE